MRDGRRPLNSALGENPESLHGQCLPERGASGGTPPTEHGSPGAERERLRVAPRQPKAEERFPAGCVTSQHKPRRPQTERSPANRGGPAYGPKPPERYPGTAPEICGSLTKARQLAEADRLLKSRRCRLPAQVPAETVVYLVVRSMDVRDEIVDGFVDLANTSAVYGQRIPVGRLEVLARGHPFQF